MTSIRVLFAGYQTRALGEKPRNTGREDQADSEHKTQRAQKEQRPRILEVASDIKKADTGQSRDDPELRAISGWS
jgi:hypothetical protein